MKDTGYKLDKKILGKNIISVILVIAVISLFYYSIGLENILSQIEKFSLDFLAMLLLIYSLFYFFLIYQWYTIINHIKKVKFTKLISIFMAGGLFNQLTPGTTTGGQPYRAFHLSRLTKLKFAESSATIIFSFCINAITQSILILASVIYLTSLDFSPSLFFIVLGLVGAVLMVMLLLIILLINIEKQNKLIFKFLAHVYHFKILKILRKKYHSYDNFKHVIVSEVTLFMNDINHFFKNKTLVIKTFLLELIIRGLYIFGLLLMFRKLSVPISIFIVILVYSLTELSNFFTFTPGGIGIVEGLLITVYSLFGVPVIAAVAVTTMNRFIIYFYEGIIGYASYVFVRNKEKV